MQSAIGLPANLGRDEFAGRDVGRGQPDPVALDDDRLRCKLLRRASSMAGSSTVPGVTTLVTSRSTSPLPPGDFTDLLADRDFVAGGDQRAM